MIVEVILRIQTDDGQPMLGEQRQRVVTRGETHEPMDLFKHAVTTLHEMVDEARHAFDGEAARGLD